MPTKRKREKVEESENEMYSSGEKNMLKFLRRINNIQSEKVLDSCVMYCARDNGLILDHKNNNHCASRHENGDSDNRR
jgi:hypothetical protein